MLLHKLSPDYWFFFARFNRSVFHYPSTDIFLPKDLHLNSWFCQLALSIPVQRGENDSRSTFRGENKTYIQSRWPESSG